MSDLAIARLADELRRASDRVALVGLSQHHHRLLQYLAGGGGVRAPRARTP